MARPKRNNVDYFPHTVTHGKKMSYIEKKYKNNGYAVWFKLLEELGKSDYHYLDLSDEVQVMFLSDKCIVGENLLFQIIEDLIKLKEFDKTLWIENKILYNESFIESIQDAYKKRNNECVSKNSLLILLDSLGVRKLSKSKLKQNKCISEVGKNTQSKVKDSKLEKTKENIDARKLKFLATLKPFYEIYGNDLINDFFEYWTEQNKSKTKFRQELEKTWDVERRLKTWARNDNNFNNKKNIIKKNSFSVNR